MALIPAGSFVMGSDATEGFAMLEAQGRLHPIRTDHGTVVYPADEVHALVPGYTPRKVEEVQPSEESAATMSTPPEDGCGPSEVECWPPPRWVVIGEPPPKQVPVPVTTPWGLAVIWSLDRSP